MEERRSSNAFDIVSFYDGLLADHMAQLKKDLKPAVAENSRDERGTSCLHHPGAAGPPSLMYNIVLLAL